MIGDRYVSTGITCRWLAHRDAWAASLKFIDAGFCNDHADTGSVSTEGTLHTRYYVQDGAAVGGLTAAIDAVISDAARLGIDFNCVGGSPSLYVDGDGEDEDVDLPEGWRGTLAQQAARLGWVTYGYPNPEGS